MEQKYPHTFSPITLGPITVRNRLEMAPACYMLASPEGYVTKEMIEYYASIARGGAGIVTVGESPIDFIHAKGHQFQLNLGVDEVHAGLCRLAEAIHKYGAVASIEVGHNGKQIISSGKPPISSSDRITVREEQAAKRLGRRRIPVEVMTQAMIDDTVEGFANALERLYRAGFRMAMIHGGHGHLITQFLSPRLNSRTDNYGGPLANRAKFALEVLDAIRSRVGNDMALEWRISADEKVPNRDGMSTEEVIEFVKMIQDKIDLIHVSSGVLEYPLETIHNIQPPYFPHGVNVPYAEQFKRALRVPVNVVGSINDIAMIEDVIAGNKADMVTMARGFLADHDFADKARRGRAEDIRPCIRCMTCVRLTGEHSHPVRCAVNPVCGRELEYKFPFPAGEKKKVVVVGGGPGGMEAALAAAGRGHQVVIYEKNSALGGNMTLAATLPFKDDLRRYLEWQRAQVEKNKHIAVKLNTAATPDLATAEKADVLIVAAGAEPVRPPALLAKKNVVWVGDVDEGRVAVGQNVVMAGAGLVGVESALQLLRDGHRVTLIDMLPTPVFHETCGAPGAEGPRGGVHLCKQLGARFIMGVKLDEVTEAGAVVMDKNWNKTLLPCDTVVLALGFRPRREAARQFAGCADEVLVIGDAVSPRNLRSAIHEGFHCAAEL